MRIEKYPSPILDSLSTPIHDSLRQREIEELTKDMKSACWDVKGFGISAIQIGEPYRIFGYFSVKKKDLIWICDPEILSLSGRSTFIEGCLSIPGYFWTVDRPETIAISYRLLNGENKVKTFNGVESRIIQHEIDHLDGLVIPDMMDNEQYAEFNYHFDSGSSIYDYEAPSLASQDLNYVD